VQNCTPRTRAVGSDWQYLVRLTKKIKKDSHDEKPLDIIINLKFPYWFVI
jgi:hypothetical protein